LILNSVQSFAKLLPRIVALAKSFSQFSLLVPCKRSALWFFKFLLKAQKKGPKW
jgi:hypothetical protein